MLGKKFEEVFQKTVMNKSGIFTLRIIDNTQGELPADFISIYANKSILIEAKSTEKKTIRKSVVKLHQLDSLVNFNRLSRFSDGIIVFYLGAANFIGYCSIKEFISLPSEIQSSDLHELNSPYDLFQTKEEEKCQNTTI
jgi:Holliday junction resolvase